MLDGTMSPIINKDKIRLLLGLEDEDDGNYSPSPLCAVHNFFILIFDEKLQCTNETSQHELECWTGGAMQRFANAP